MDERYKKMSASERERAFLQDSLEDLAEMSSGEVREIAIRAGILSDDGELTNIYGGKAEPSRKYTPVDMAG